MYVCKDSAEPAHARTRAHNCCSHQAIHLPSSHTQPPKTVSCKLLGVRALVGDSPGTPSCYLQAFLRGKPILNKYKCIVSSHYIINRLVRLGISMSEFRPTLWTYADFVDIREQTSEMYHSSYQPKRALRNPYGMVTHRGRNNQPTIFLSGHVTPWFFSVT